MKQFKTLVALVLALALTLTLIGAAFAEDPDPAPAVDTTPYQHPISVSGLAAGETATFYKMVAWVGEDADAVAGWKAVSPYNGSGLLDKAGLTAVLLGTPVANSDPVRYENPTGITPELAGKLAKVATGGTEVTADNTGKATLSTNEAGIYMVLVTPGDANTLYNPIFVSADYSATTPNDQAASNYGDAGEGGTATAKKSTITLTKTSYNAKDYTPDTTAKTTAVGDTVSFTVNTTIPAYGDVYTNPHFVLKDTLTDLTLKENTVTITSPTGLQNTDYTLNTTEDGYTITFAASYLKTVKSATTLTVTYDAVVASSAEYAINEEDNEVMIEYSHNPASENDYDVKKDSTQHYTFTLDADALGFGQSVSGKKTSEIVKVGVDANGNPITERTEKSDITETNTWQSPLAGATFGLFKNEQCTGEPYKTQITGEDGRMEFAGLDAGNYWLKEIEPPTGYVADSTPVSVVIAATFKTVTVTEYYDAVNDTWVATDNGGKSATYETEILDTYTVTVGGVAAATYTFANEDTASSTEIKWDIDEMEELPHQFQNTKAVTLPSTGGIGTTIFYVAGIVLVLGAAAIIVARRKAEQN